MDPSVFSQEEEKVLAFWDKERIFERSLEQTKNGTPFVFYEGPPTANGRPGIHHVLARVFKDLIPRFETMHGRYVARKAGWDTHGLPVEIEVEKKLGLKSKRDIENLVPGDRAASIAKFNAECKKSVWTYLEDWRKLTKRMAYWIDLERPYVTYETPYMETLWHIIKTVFEKGLLKKTFRVQPFCTRCGTGLSSHELALGYDKVEDTAVYIKFPITNFQFSNKFQTSKEKVYLLSWTTTPWTLPGNVALAVNKDIDYCAAKVGGEVFVLAKDRLSVLGQAYEVLAEFKGRELVGWQYQSLFDVPALRNEKSYRVYAADFVTMTEGTGIVHTAVMYGEDDFALGEQVGLPKVHTVNEDGTFNDLVPELKGLLVKDEQRVTERKILEILGDRVLKEETISHDYPFCWRCHTSLLYMAREAWVIEMSNLRKELIANNEHITWEPAHIKEGRFGEWLKEAKDWTFSRERYWGTPLPVWECDKCGVTKAVGSLAELPYLPKNNQGEVDLHRPYIDAVTFPCDKCDGVMQRVPYVCDVWFDSGSMPFAQNHWPFDEPRAQSLEQRAKLPFPADYISEGVDQTRGWFYTLLAVATLLGKGAPYKRVISLGHILDAKGEKMSKSKGNIVDPWQQIAKHGIDPIRWYFFTVNEPGLPKRYDERALKAHFNQFFILLWNTFQFLALYAPARRQLDGGLVTAKSGAKLHLLDKWILARMRQLVATVTEQTEALQITAAARAIEMFVDDLSRWYVRRSRTRMQEGAGPSRSVLASVLVTISTVMAPYVPIFSERLYQGLRPFLKGKRWPESVHLATWPKVGALTKAEQKLLIDMASVRELVAEGLQQRAATRLKVRQPLAKAATTIKLSAALAKIVAEELNVKKLEVRRWELEDGKIKLDTKLTPELVTEGHLRELVRAVQQARRDLGFTPKDTILVTLTETPEVTTVLIGHRQEFMAAVRAKTITTKASVASERAVKLGQSDICLKVEKVLCPAEELPET